MRFVRYGVLALATLSGLACGNIDDAALQGAAAHKGTGGSKGNPTGGKSGAGGSGGAGSGGGSGGTTNTGGTGGSTGGSGGSTGGTGGSTGGTGGSTGGSGGSTGGTGGGTGGTGGTRDAGAADSGSKDGNSGVDAGAKLDAAGDGRVGARDAGTAIDAQAEQHVDSGAPPVNTGLWVAPNHPCYEWDALPPSQVPWTHLTHLGLGYMQPKASGGRYTPIEAPGWQANGFTGFQSAAIGYADAAHAASKKTFMMLGGANSNTGDFAGVWNTATSPANIDAFADDIVSIMKGMNMDGVELDWEEDIAYPQLVSLAQKVRARWADGLIFVDAMPLDSGSFAGLAPAKDAVDAFMPMTFLAVRQWGGWVLPIPPSPLYGYPGNGYSIDDNLQGFTAAGVPASKVLMGVGGYGSVWGDSNNDNTAPIAPYVTTSGSGAANTETGDMYSDGLITQSWVKNLVSNSQGKMIEGWDDIGKSSYWHAPATTDLVTATVRSTSFKAGLVFYETPRSMTEKANYAQTKGMRGMNFWTLKQMIDGTSSPILETIMP
jgi:GH18 family chitinase